MSEQPLSFEQYLDALPPERRGEVERVWRVVRENMPAGYVEDVGPKFLSFKAGDEWYVGLASQKNYISLYLVPVYVFPELRAKLDAGGKKLKCGKSCVNFKRADELPLEALAEIVGATGAEAFRERVLAAKGKR
ncbi:MAG TPA: DUF1801 domain-containing protein [Pyrinomonadaceae bacterium]|jgi:hypothetical protein